MVNYFKDTDYYGQIKPDLLNRITTNDVTVRARAENTALAYFESHLKGRFDTDVVFLRFNDWDELINYTTGERIVHEDVVYQALEDSIGVIPGASSSNEWKFIFRKNDLVTTYLVDIALYHINARVAFDQASVIRQERFDQAKEWLKSVAQGNLDPNLPRLDSNQDGTPDDLYFKWSSSKNKFNSKGRFY